MLSSASPGAARTPRIQGLRKATGREFLLIVRVRGLKDKEIFSYLNRIEKTLNENGFSAKRYDGENIKTLLAVYFEQNITTEKFENFDGERWIANG